MPIIEDTFTASLDAVASSTADLPRDVSAVRPLGDDALLAVQRMLADARRAIDACASLVAGEVKHRSRHELGYTGLAQRTGFRTPEALVQHMTGSTARDAATLVQVGAMVHDAPDAELYESWLSEVGAAVRAGTLTVDAAKAIRSGLGSPTASVSIADLQGAVGQLLSEEPDLHADGFLRRARELRDELDIAGVATCEQAIREERAVRRLIRPNGQRRYIIDTDLESGAYLDDVYDKLTSPRRGGVRFVADDDRAWADAIATDPRTLEQYAHDSFVQLLRVGVETDLRAVRSGVRRTIGSRQPAVRVVTTLKTVERREGRGYLEGVQLPVSIETVERIACSEGTVSIAFDDGQVLNLGREARLFTPAQRVALAARDGGCIWVGCERPPEWTEAHHIKHWVRDQGRSDIADGVLLCRFHHMLVHNNGWQVVREGNNYLLIPPEAIDPSRTSIQLRSKSRALLELARE